MDQQERDDSTQSTAVAIVVFAVLALLALGGVGYWFVARQQMAGAERARLAAESAALMARAQQTHDQAQALARTDAAPPALLRAWQSAFEATRAAAEAAASLDPEGEAHRQAQALLAAVREQRDAAGRTDQSDRERALLARLADALVPHTPDLGQSGWATAEARCLDATLARLSRDHDLLAPPASRPAARQMPPDVAQAVARSLDAWALARAFCSVEGETALGDILAAGERFDPGDALRQRCRAVLRATAGQTSRLEVPEVPDGDLAPASACLLAGLLASTGNEPAALALADRALARTPADYPLLVLRGLLLERAQPPRFDQAATCWAAALELQPESAALRYRLALASLHSGDVERARAALGQLLRREPRNVEWNATLAEVEHAAGDDKAAVAALREAARSRPDDARLQRRLAQLLVLAGELEPALQSYRRLAARSGKDADLWHEMGRVMLRLRGYESAADAFARALELRPGFLEAQCDLGSAHLDREDLPAAVAALRAALAIDAKHARSHLRLGEALERQSDLDGALVEYRAACESAPDYAEAWCAAGALLRRRGRYVESLDCYRRGHELGSKRGSAWEHPSADWLATAEKLARVELRLLPIVEGKAAAGSASELLDVVEYAYLRGAHLAAARAYEAAAGSDPGLMASLTGDQREKAAFAAALAGCGRGDGAAALDAAARQRWRQQALAWLRAELDKRQTEAKETRALANRAGRIVRRWQEIADLAGVRDEEPLATLPASEAALWRAFWQDVDALAEPAK